MPNPLSNHRDRRCGDVIRSVRPCKYNLWDTITVWKLPAKEPLGSWDEDPSQDPVKCLANLESGFEFGG